MIDNLELAQQRLDRSDKADRLLRQLFSSAADKLNVDSGEGSGITLVAVGGYGRRELSPFSDLDVVLVHDPKLPPELIAKLSEDIWYPVWERKIALDHAVRTEQQMIETAASDIRAAMGMLDVRCVAGDPSLLVRLRSTVLNQWRKDARLRVPEIRESRAKAVDRFGQLAYTAVPELKESGGGLRDSVVLRALVATWLIDVPHGESEALRSQLLDVRDLLHEAAGRGTDRLTPEHVPAIAARLGMSPIQTDLYTRDLGRRIAHLSRRAWRDMDLVLRRDPRRVVRREPPRIETIAPGVGVLDGEVVLARGADPASDPELVLRVAAAAARERLAINEAAIRRLAQQSAPIPEPWSPTANRALVELLSAGAGVVDVWEQLDFHGIVTAICPEWSGIRLRGSSSPVHKFTVDRHSLQACVVADELNREVARPDVLTVAAILHDIGKGRPGDHSQVGEPMAVQIALRWGFSEEDARTIGRLVRWHLLLPTIATGRDIEDPNTAANVAELVESLEFLKLLAALTECDARSTSDAAWSSWRRGLIEGLIEKVAANLEGTEDTDSAGYEGWPAHVPMPELRADSADGFGLEVMPHLDGSLVTIVTARHPGVVADLAGALSLAGLQIRSARLVSLDDGSVASLWEVSRPELDAESVRQRLRAVASGQVDLREKLRYSAAQDAIEPRVRVLDAMEQTATLLEVRTQDRRALMWTVCRAIADLGWAIRSLHTATYGDEARDVFYVIDHEGLALYDHDAGILQRAVQDALA